ncbi:hypothetical protein PGTUg99_025770 [Puccinia graminis f. sp. tritici]|uniref:Uncharacterized protein n=1 Tax=Puccinia graminis f. sp. tritici TaxID=56615 RepID=A0A5B0M6V6_PUCGR|nr:hypothetical protein PGTUg99_025770 [Puccinia graminis f. sp. tritici]
MIVVREERMASQAKNDRRRRWHSHPLNRPPPSTTHDSLPGETSSLLRPSQNVRSIRNQESPTSMLLAVLSNPPNLISRACPMTRLASSKPSSLADPSSSPVLLEPGNHIS